MLLFCKLMTAGLFCTACVCAWLIPETAAAAWVFALFLVFGGVTHTLESRERWRR